MLSHLACIHNENGVGRRRRDLRTSMPLLASGSKEVGKAADLGSMSSCYQPVLECIIVEGQLVRKCPEEELLGRVV